MIQQLEFGGLIIGPWSTGYTIENHSGLDFPVVRVNVSDFGNTDGSTLGSHFYGSRKMSIEGQIIGASPADFESKRRALQAACDISGGLKRLTITTRGGLVVRADAIITNTPGMVYEKGHMVYGNFRLELTAPFPFFLGNQIKTQVISPVIGGGGPVPSPIPFPIGGGDESGNIVNNLGNVAAYWTARIYGPIEDPVFRNATTNEQVTFDITLATSDDYLEFDSRLNTVKDQDGLNQYDLKTGDFWKIKPGSNYLRLLAAEVNGGYAVITYQDHYLGL